MFRRVVSLFLLPCVLLAQSAAHGHAHGGCEPAGHNLRPHLHGNATSVPGRHDHGHHHHGPGHPHHHHDDGDDASGPDMQPTTQPALPADHDSDAVYIASVDVVVSKRSAIENEFTASLTWAATDLSFPPAFWDYPPDEATAWTHPPPTFDGFRPLYVRYLTLLI